MDFQHPWALALLLLLPLLYWAQRRWTEPREGSLRFSSHRLWVPEQKRRGQWKIRLLQTLTYLVLALLVLGLSRPRRIDSLEKEKVEVVDILLVIDISSSMLADDFPPNRLEAVKATAREFVHHREGDRIGVVVFAAESFIQCPLTVDIDVVDNLISEIMVAEREYDGTAIGMAIANGVNRLRDSEAKSKVMVLLSDGSNNAGELDPLTAADLAAEFGIKIYTIGAGTDQSVTFIPNRGYIRNEIDEKTLRQIADRTGGKYFRAVDVDALKAIYDEIDQLERTEVEVKQYTHYRELFPWFLIPALVLGVTRESLRIFVFRKRI
ncbi:MAG: VWA domain-containing protein [Candidatus Neomarinimicrobiota bacterium]|nr:MAG: VWA domain-containing protein [Candidatus Neomarinimicrobiota bacterium]